MCVPLGDGGVYVIFILTYAGVRDVHLAANAGLWVFIGLCGVGGGKHPELSEAGKRDGGNPSREGARAGSQGRWWVAVTLSVLQHLNSRVEVTSHGAGRGAAWAGLPAPEGRPSVASSPIPGPLLQLSRAADLSWACRERGGSDARGRGWGGGGWSSAGGGVVSAAVTGCG